MSWYYQLGAGLIVIAVIVGFILNWSQHASIEDQPTAPIATDHAGQHAWGTAKLQGRRQYMEDTCSQLIKQSVQLFGVYDGHGNDRVSLYLENFLLNEIYKRFFDQHASAQNNTELIRETLFKGFLSTNEEYKEYAKKKWNDWDSGGSTAVVGAVYQEKGNYRLAVANTGDSRAVYCCKSSKDRVYPMSYDHKPNDPAEKERIEQTGGFIAKAARGPWRVNGILATSRAFGDFSLSPQVIADPEIIDIELGRIIMENGKPIFQIQKELSQHGANLILASDGLWDVFTNQEAASYVHQLRVEGHTPEEIADILVQASYKKRSTDNITAMIVFVDELIVSLV